MRAEDALARGQLREDALEFFLLVVRRLCAAMELPVAIASKTVGREVGRQESATKLASVMEHWRTVWNGKDVRSKEELLLMVAVDDRKVPQDWMCVSVRASAKGQRLGDATKLVVRIHDAAKRPSVARRVARNLDVLLRGVGGAVDSTGPEVEFLTVPACPVVSQRCLCAFGLLLGHVALHAGTPALDMSSPSFVPDVGHVLRAAFSEFRTDAGARGLRDVDRLLTEKAACRAVLVKLGVAPALVPAREPHAVLRKVSPAAVDGALSERGGLQCMFRVATWNVAGGLKSDDAPSAYSLIDQHASVMREVLRWERSYGCDVLALQECQAGEALAELGERFAFVGSAEAHATRGFVHLYVRRGVEFEVVSLAAAGPSVAVRVRRAEAKDNEGLILAAVHLPSGDSSGKRREIMTRLVGELGDEDNVCIVGDMNTKAEELEELCKTLRLGDARYAGVSFGAQGNRFDHRLPKRSFGHRYDHVLFGKGVWAESHLIGNGPVCFDGSEFHLSDHCGVLAYVDVCGAYMSKTTQDIVAARVRRARMPSL